MNRRLLWGKASECMQKFNCKTCGAELYWDSEANCLKCEYCDSEYQVSEFEMDANEQGQAGVKSQTQSEKQSETGEPQKADEYSKATDDSELEDLVVYQCSHCKAEIITARSTVATTCAFCGRAISITNKLVDEFKPDAIIPFSISEKEAKELYKKYVNSTFLTPNAFGTEAVLKKMKGIYVPFWLHSFESDSRAVIYCENVSSHRSGDDKVIDHYMYHVTVEAKGRFKDVPTDGLKHLDDTLMDAIEPFDYSKLVEFNTAYMAGYYAEEYNENDKVTRGRATERAKQTMVSKMEQEAGVYAVKRLISYDENLSEENAKYAMLPVWLLNVTYKGKEYLYAINGETGKIVGKLPISMQKLLFTISATLVGTYFITSIIRFLTLL